MARSRRVLSVAVDCENNSAAFFIDGLCKEVRTSRKASGSASRARSALRVHIFEREPELVVFEDPAQDSPKGGASRSIVRALLQAVEDEGLIIMRVPRKVLDDSGYLDLSTLKARLPEAAHHLPKPRSFPEKTSKRQAVVNALALAAVALDQLRADPND